jgi:hypothetical protein
MPEGKYYAVYTHSGSRNFITHLYYGDDRKAYITNGLGVCTERTGIISMADCSVENGYLEVQADGEWAIEIFPVSISFNLFLGFSPLSLSFPSIDFLLDTVC